MWTPPTRVTLLGPRHHRARRFIRTLPTGERVGVEIDDSGTVTHIHHNHTLDAIVTPRTIQIARRPR